MVGLLANRITKPKYSYATCLVTAEAFLPCDPTVGFPLSRAFRDGCLIGRTQRIEGSSAKTSKISNSRGRLGRRWYARSAVSLPRGRMAQVIFCVEKFYSLQD